jgi:hypothetical protein
MKYSFDLIADHTHRVNINVLKGTINLETFVAHLKRNFANTNYSDQYAILVDIREAELPDFLGKMHEFIDFIQQASKETSLKRKCAIVTSTPRDVVIGEMLRLRLEEINFDLKVSIFSSREAALYWL